MPTTFRELVFENRNSISVQLTLEAPVGTQIIETEVRANSTVTLNPNVNDVSTAKMTVVAGGHEHTDVETFDLRGSPFQIRFETMRAQAAIGSIKGSISTVF